jgi:hypothetical protein
MTSLKVGSGGGTGNGVLQRQYEVPGEAKYIDVWFIPKQDHPSTEGLGLLGQMIQKPCLFEPYRNVPTRTEVRISVMKSKFKLKNFKFQPYWIAKFTQNEMITEKPQTLLQ